MKGIYLSLVEDELITMLVVGAIVIAVGLTAQAIAYKKTEKLWLRDIIGGIFDALGGLFFLVWSGSKLTERYLLSDLEKLYQGGMVFGGMIMLCGAVLLISGYVQYKAAEIEEEKREAERRCQNQVPQGKQTASGPVRNSSTTTRRNSAGTNVICPRCGLEQVLGQGVCLQCGTTLYCKETNQNGENRYCTQCGAILQEGNRYCGKCGSKTD